MYEFILFYDKDNRLMEFRYNYSGLESDIKGIPKWCYRLERLVYGNDQYKEAMNKLFELQTQFQKDSYL